MVIAGHYHTLTYRRYRRQMSAGHITANQIAAENALPGFYMAFKRCFDVILSFTLMAILIVPCLILSVFIALSVKASPIFRQQRSGRWGNTFKIVKFRTMSSEAPKDVATHQLDDAHKYISSLGRVLRKYSIDELPQLINIFKGDMTFIGPRPVVLSEIKLITLRGALGADCVRPGLSGLAQISGRDHVTVEEKAQLDKQYIESVGLRQDVRIFFLSIKKALCSEGIREGAFDAPDQPTAAPLPGGIAPDVISPEAPARPVITYEEAAPVYAGTEEEPASAVLTRTSHI